MTCPVSISMDHLHHSLSKNNERISVVTQYGPVIGGRTSNGVAVFLEIPYALPPKRFTDPEPLQLDHRYENKEYIKESSYATQPNNDGQAAHVPYQQWVGLGHPTENPLFLNVFVPPSFPTQAEFPVKVYFHGGFLQFGSPHALSAQAQYVCAERSEVWVNIGYRLSAFGFLACDKPQLNGNYGFKDQWLALQWVQSNIRSFGGDPNNIQLQGVSAGSHSIHQQLHRVSCLPEGQYAPFQSAILQSNAILSDPKTPEELRPQFRALCQALKLNPDSPDILDILRDPIKVPWTEITRVIETDVVAAQDGTFRGCLSGDWIHTSPGPMERQRNGDFARALRERGVQSIVVGEVVDEWYIYSLSHPISSPLDIVPNLKRYFPDAIVEKLMLCFKKLPENASQKEAKELFGRMLSSVQVHIPIRLLHRDLLAAGFPVVRYLLEWTPEQLRHDGYVTHGTDRAIWSLLNPLMTSDQADVARRWLNSVQEEAAAVRKTEDRQDPSVVLRLTKDERIEWSIDRTYDELLSTYSSS